MEYKRQLTQIFFLITALVMISPTLIRGEEYSFRLKNSLNIERCDELVEITIPEGIDCSQYALFNSDNENVPYHSTGKTILFQANIKNGDIAEYILKEGTKLNPDTKTYASCKLPSTRNDIAWENDLSVFRMYSSKLLSSEPNTANGVDVWYKKRSYPVIDKMYNYSNYHSEGEEGVDAHSVNGKTLGGGGVGVYYKDKLWIHNPYDKCEFIENGPLRSEFILTYYNVDVDGDKYTKTLRITTCANSLLNKAVVKYEGPAKKMKISAGIFLHTNMGYNTNGVTYESEKNIIGLAEDKSEGTVTSPNARMYAGIYMPGETETAVVDHHLMIMSDYEPGTELIYYFGAGWNIFPIGKYISDDDWFYELNKFKQTITHPIVETSFETLPKKNDVIDVIYKSNNYWQETNPTHGNAFWNRAAYHTGNMEAYKVTQEQSYLQYSTDWSIQNVWKGAKSDNKEKWKYTYGESDDYVLFGDWQICFQVYCDLYKIDPQDYKIARAREVMEYQMSTAADDYWWWADGLYMVMPVMTRLYKITGNDLYLEKLHEYWQYANSIMYDEEEGIYYRDGKYVYPAHSTTNGKKDFWARGNGWVFAAFARILEDLPQDDKYRQTYISYYKRMAKRLAELQMPQGYWSRSLVDPDYASGYETSGTAFFVYGYLWGINNGYLSEKEYGKTVEKGWDYLTNIALQPSGKVGYVQPIGENAAQHNVNAETTADFGVGAFLIAAAEMSKYAVGDMPKQVVRLYSTDITNRITIKAVFSKTLMADQALNIANYSLNNEPIKGSLSFDGDRTVTIQLDTPLDYGRHYLNIENLKSVDEELLEEDCSKAIIITVPSYPIKTGINVSAIANQSGNPAPNAIDNNFNTRWSQEGIDQWIMLDLGSEYKVWGVDLAFYSGNQRKSFFDVEISLDKINFEKVLISQESSGVTNDMERYLFTSKNARYIRIMCKGNSVNNWNSVTELRACYSDENIFEDIVFPDIVTSDILMPTGVTWSSSDQSVFSFTGYVTPQSEDRVITMTASIGELKKDFTVKVPQRNPEQNNIMLYYGFESDDIYNSATNIILKDRSGNDNDAIVNGSAIVNGKLDLTKNTNAGISTNGYLLAPSGLISSLRSFSILAKINPERIANLPRLYDFGSSPYNSFFGSLTSPSMGLKYNSGATKLIEASSQIETGRENRVAFTFDARTKTSKIYIDGILVAESNLIQNEPYEIAQIAPDKRNYIGRTQWWDTNYASSNVDFCGTIDDFYMFDLALTLDEINMFMDKQNNTASLDNEIKDNGDFNVSKTYFDKGEEIVLYSNTNDPYDVHITDLKGAVLNKKSSSLSQLSLGTVDSEGIYFINIFQRNNNYTIKIFIK